MRWFLLALVMAATLGVAAEDAQQLILGDWCAGPDPAFHETFSLTIEEERQVFASWLHERPAESGSWTLKKGILRIQTHAGQTYVYSVVRLTPTKLVLQQDGQAAETYVRDGCRSFEGPPIE